MDVTVVSAIMAVLGGRGMVAPASRHSLELTPAEAGADKLKLTALVSARNGQPSSSSSLLEWGRNKLIGDWILDEARYLSDTDPHRCGSFCGADVLGAIPLNWTNRIHQYQSHCIA